MPNSVTPQKFFQDLWAARGSLALIAATDLDIFTAIAEGHKTPANIAKAIKGSSRGVERLLNALAGLGYLTKRGSQFGLTPVSDAFLVPARPGYLGALPQESKLTMAGWMQLADVIRRGHGVASIDADQGRDFFPKLVRAIFPMMYHSAHLLASSLPQAKLKKIERILDVAA